MALFLDTNIFIYAKGREHPYKKSCTSILEAVIKNKIVAYIDTEVLQEIYYRESNKEGRGIIRVKKILDFFDPDKILPVTYKDIILTGKFLEAYEGIEPRDAIHLAVVANNKIENFCTADKGIKQVKEVKAIDPIDLEKQLKKVR